MSILTRNALKNFFRRGSCPSEVNFSDLIDSSVNKIDDGFAKSSENGLMLSPQGHSRRLISFFNNIRDKDPAWSVNINNDKRSEGLSVEDTDGHNHLFLKKGGGVGIGTNVPNYPLQVNGLVGMAGRIGTLKQGQVPGDGRWQTILSDLDGPQAFEIVAQISGAKGRGKYAMTHAIALSLFGGGRGAITKTRAYYGWFWNRINVRWKGKTHNYQLQLRTGSHYGLNDDGLPYMIKYSITKLWEDQAYTIPTPDVEVAQLAEATAPVALETLEI